jgi:hypothetical protein
MEIKIRVVLPNRSKIPDDRNPKGLPLQRTVSNTPKKTLTTALRRPAFHFI